MTESRSIRSTIKWMLPPPFRRVLRAPYTYCQRLWCWVYVLAQVRGVSVHHELKLLMSAALAPFTSLANLDQWQDPLLLYDIWVKVPGIGKFFLRKRTDDLYHVLPHREIALIRTMKRLLLPGDSFVDAGANIGVYTVLGSRLVGGNGRVLAIEMMHDTALILRSHVDCNNCSNTLIIEQPLSDRVGRIVTARVSAGKHGQASIIRTDYAGDVSEVSLQTTTLDALLEDELPIKLIKMDLEGAEDLAIQGAAGVLKRTHALIFEDWSRSAEASSEKRQVLESLGFNLQRIDGSNWLAIRGG